MNDDREKKIEYLEKLSTIFDEYQAKVVGAGIDAQCYAKDPSYWPDELLDFTIEETKRLALKIQAL